jgi:hypothetical protein
MQRERAGAPLDPELADVAGGFAVFLWEPQEEPAPV